MTSQDAFGKFRTYVNSQRPEDPNVDFLRRHIKEGFKIHEAEFVRAEDVLQRTAPEFHLTLRKDQNSQPLRLPWTPDVETILLSEHIQMATLDQESSRGAYLLVKNVELGDQTWGKDYTNQVLHDILRENFGNTLEFQRLLAMVAYLSPKRSNQYSDCSNFLQQALGGYANSLILELHYEEEQADSIFSLAVFKMFDERHHLTLQRILCSR